MLLNGALFLLAAAPLQAKPAGLPAELREIAAETAVAHPGAVLVKLAAVIGQDGRARRCPKEGWPNRYGGYAMTFQTPAGGQWMVVECGPREPTKAFLSRQPPFEQRFIGIEEALEALKKSGLALDADTVMEAELRLPAELKGFPAGVPFWIFRSKEGFFFVDAQTGELRGAGKKEAAPSGGGQPGKGGKRPAGAAPAGGTSRRSPTGSSR